MGYSHFHSRPKTLPAGKFRSAAEDCRRLVETLGVPLQKDYENNGPPQFDREAVRLNGVDDDGYEDFDIERENPYGYGSCKTNRKPYDLAVCCCLVVFKHHFGRRFQVSSDGDDGDENWSQARDACQRVLGYGEDFSVMEFDPLPLAGLTVDRDRRSVSGGADRGYGYGVESSLVPSTFTLVKWRRTYFAPSGRKFEVYPRGCSRYAGPVGSAPTVAEARWLATCLMFRDRFKDAPGLDVFVSNAERSPGDWTPLAVWSDYLEEAGDRRYRWLRQMLPRVLRRVPT